jgi:hypothetical protein
MLAVPLWRAGTRTVASLEAFCAQERWATDLHAEGGRANSLEPMYGMAAAPTVCRVVHSAHIYPRGWPAHHPTSDALNVRLQVASHWPAVDHPEAVHVKSFERHSGFAATGHLESLAESNSQTWLPMWMLWCIASFYLLSTIFVGHCTLQLVTGNRMLKWHVEVVLWVVLYGLLFTIMFGWPDSPPSEDVAPDRCRLYPMPHFQAYIYIYALVLSFSKLLVAFGLAAYLTTSTYMNLSVAKCMLARFGSRAGASRMAEEFREAFEYSEMKARILISAFMAAWTGLWAIMQFRGISLDDLMQSSVLYNLFFYSCVVPSIIRLIPGYLEVTGNDRMHDTPG